MRRRFFTRPERKFLSAEEIKEQVPIEVVLAELGAQVSVRGSWDRWVSVRCPLHNDHSASASVHRAWGLFKCHVCHEGAKDIFALVREELVPGASFVEAKDYLVERFVK